MDKASAYGAEDSGFESLCGQFLFAVFGGSTIALRARAVFCLRRFMHTAAASCVFVFRNDSHLQEINK